MENDESVLIERKRKDQGLHECEVFGSESGEMEANKAWASCMKNPGHTSFIPYPDFHLKHLPDGWQTQELWRQVINLAEKTVKLRVGYTSMNRPEGYAFYNNRGSSLVHTGSGWIEQVLSRTDSPCPCNDCLQSETPYAGVWLEVNVITARHVVYNKEEAKSTWVDVHYNTTSSRRNGEMQTILAYDFFMPDNIEDACVLVCAAHDLNNVQLEIPFKISLRPTPDLKVSRDDPCVVISHPHGQPKKVTVGQVKKADFSNPEALVSYSTPTCPGCSGAPVLCLYSDNSKTFSQSSVHNRGGVTGGYNQGSCFIIDFE